MKILTEAADPGGKARWRLFLTETNEVFILGHSFVEFTEDALETWPIKINITNKKYAWISISEYNSENCPKS